jgi:hypothetical protein
MDADGNKNHVLLQPPGWSLSLPVLRLWEPHITPSQQEVAKEDKTPPHPLIAVRATTERGDLKGNSTAGFSDPGLGSIIPSTL